MKLPRRKFLHLTAGAAALPLLSRIAIHRGRCVWSSVPPQEADSKSSHV